ncbi:hypothetical protein O181_054263 [Austropuccinia psidii MF-1]|uniref:C2H2-type domain-containing protein n=1 Tax=Austropuccinia psidii MF-1 TaxID=1389203 RepID=A0A9Q3E5Y1_9BASI|nr:hypothetical protein [Austropuccinia psidii MF-1]
MDLLVVLSSFLVSLILLTSYPFLSLTIIKAQSNGLSGCIGSQNTTSSISSITNDDPFFDKNFKSDSIHHHSYNSTSNFSSLNKKNSSIQLSPTSLSPIDSRSIPTTSTPFAFTVPSQVTQNEISHYEEKQEKDTQSPTSSNSSNHIKINFDVQQTQFSTPVSLANSNLVNSYSKDLASQNPRPITAPNTDLVATTNYHNYDYPSARIGHLGNSDNHPHLKQLLSNPLASSNQLNPIDTQTEIEARAATAPALPSSGSGTLNSICSSNHEPNPSRLASLTRFSTPDRSTNLTQTKSCHSRPLTPNSSLLARTQSSGNHSDQVYLHQNLTPHIHHNTFNRRPSTHAGTSSGFGGNLEEPYGQKTLLPGPHYHSYSLGYPSSSRPVTADPSLHSPIYDRDISNEPERKAYEPFSTRGPPSNGHYYPIADDSLKNSPQTSHSTTENHLGVQYNLNTFNTLKSRPNNNGALESHGKLYHFNSLPGAPRKRARRRYDEIERLYSCNYPGCTKAYGTLNHLNAHIMMQKHGPKRLPQEFKEIRKEWRARKKAEAEARATLYKDSPAPYVLPIHTPHQNDNLALQNSYHQNYKVLASEPQTQQFKQPLGSSNPSLLGFSLSNLSSNGHYSNLNSSRPRPISEGHELVGATQWKNPITHEISSDSSSQLSHILNRTHGAPELNLTRQFAHPFRPSDPSFHTGSEISMPTSINNLHSPVGLAQQVEGRSMNRSRPT